MTNAQDRNAIGAIDSGYEGLERTATGWRAHAEGEDFRGVTIEEAADHLLHEQGFSDGEGIRDLIERMRTGELGGGACSIEYAMKRHARGWGVAQAPSVERIGSPLDEIDRLEREIAQLHMDVAYARAEATTAQRKWRAALAGQADLPAIIDTYGGTA